MEMEGMELEKEFGKLINVVEMDLRGHKEKN